MEQQPAGRVTQRDLYEKLDKLEQRILARIDKLEEKFEEKYVLRAEFEPVRKIVYGVVGLMLSGIILALLGVVLANAGG